MYYAELDEDNLVLRVIVATEDFISKIPGKWVCTCMAGIKSKNYAGIGQVYDPTTNSFIPPPWERFSKLEEVRDNNGKRLYYKVAEGPHKSQVKKVPVTQKVYYLRNKVTQKVTKSQKKPEIIAPESN